MTNLKNAIVATETQQWIKEAANPANPKNRAMLVQLNNGEIALADKVKGETEERTYEYLAGELDDRYELTTREQEDKWLIYGEKNRVVTVSEGVVVYYKIIPADFEWDIWG